MEVRERKEVKGRRCNENQEYTLERGNRRRAKTEWKETK